MPRFNQARWNPSQDSSPQFIQRAIKEKKVFLERAYEGPGVTDRPSDAPLAGCPCGCGTFPKGRGRFAMGHDARFRGILIRAHLTGTPIVYPVAGEDHEAAAMELAKAYGASFTKALQDAELRREGKNREVLRKAIGSDRLIKVGRWEYTGQVVAVYGEPGAPDDDSATVYEVEYVTKMGEKKRAKVDAADAKEVTG